MKTLVLLHGSAKPAEKRQMVQNCFSNCTVHGKKLCLETQNWFVEAKNVWGVPVADPQRHTSRRGCMVEDSDFQSFVRDFVGISQCAKEEDLFTRQAPHTLRLGSTNKAQNEVACADR
jgi:hypothetical protein